MKVGYRIKLLKLMSGERLPLLLDENGEPLFQPTIYALTELRARNQATNTISAALRAIKVFYLFLHIRGIDFPSRLHAGQLFSLGEIEDLTRLSRLPIERLEAMLSTSAMTDEQPKVIPLEQARTRLQQGAKDEVDPNFAGSRIRYISAYLEWQVSELLGRQSLDKQVATGLNTALQRVLPAIAARIPKGTSGKGLDQREGLAPEDAAELLRVLPPQSPDNPWQSIYSRHRNELLVHWLYYFGLRRGELLGVRVRDVDFRKGTVTIHRRADDVDDSRKNQPQSKTKARKIPIGENLKSLTYAYVMNHRSASKGAGKHEFLFCADKTGEPLSLSAVNKVFKVLRTKCPNLPDSLCPHVMRHTWNDRYSEEMDKRKITEEDEKKTRSYLMGWSETSGTAATYTRRHIRKKAQEVLLKMQEQLVGEG